MDEGDDSAVTANRELPAGVDNILRTITRRAKAPHAVDEAREWAHRTLKEAGLPSFVGWYAPGPDGKSLVPAPPEMIGRETDRSEIVVRLKPDEPADVAWVATLPRAVARLGYGIETPERQAAELLYQLWVIEGRIRQGNARAAAGEAFYAGMRWERRQAEKAGGVRAARLAGARKAAATNVKHAPEDMGHWVIADRLLERDEELAGLPPKGRARKRAERLAPRFGVPEDTFRREVREIRRKTDPKK